MAVGDAHVFPGFLTSVITHFFSKPWNTLLTCFSRGERRKYVGKEFRLNRISNSQQPGHECDTLAIEPPVGGGGGLYYFSLNIVFHVLSYLHFFILTHKVCISIDLGITTFSVLSKTTLLFKFHLTLSQTKKFRLFQTERAC